MKTRIGTLAVLTAALACAPAYAAPVKVKLRIEGNVRTVLERNVVTDVHEVTGDESGPHKCDGTNGGANPTPGPTAIGALDDGSRAHSFNWSGSFSSDFDDFLVNQIGPDTARSNRFWGLAVNGAVTPTGGCQTQVEEGDEVLFYYGGTFNGILRATGPRKVRAGRRFRVRAVAVVTTFDSSGRATSTVRPVKGARIGAGVTNSKGYATLRYRRPGLHGLKARRDGMVRSNQVRVKILPRRG